MIRFTVELKREKKLLSKLHETSTLGIINLVISRRINFFPFSCSRDPKTFNDTLVTIVTIAKQAVRYQNINLYLTREQSYNLLC